MGQDRGEESRKQWDILRSTSSESFPIVTFQRHINDSETRGNYGRGGVPFLRNSFDAAAAWGHNTCRVRARLLGDPQ